MLCFARERYPTHRVDITELFGRELIGRGHEIDFVMQAASTAVTPGPTSWNGRTVWVGAARGGTGLVSRLRHQWAAVAHDFRCLSMARRDRYDAIQVRDKFLIAAWVALTARRRGQKFFYWLSFPEPEAQLLRVRDGTARYRWLTAIRGGFFWLLLYRWILPRCDHVFVQSERMRRDVAACGIPSQKMTAVPMGIPAVDLDRFSGVASEVSQDLRRRSVVLGYLGTMVIRRQLTVLVDMLADLVRRGIDVRLLFVGDGEHASDREAIEDRARQLGVRDRIEITGFLKRDVALRKIQEVDIALSPFFPTPILLSTSPTKLIEYMALGLPVVANDHPEQRLILRESRAGVRVPWGARHFARAVAYLCRLPDASRRAVGMRGREWVRLHRSYDRIADVVESAYLSHLKGAGFTDDAGGQPEPRRRER
ncbi:MAG: glycosyltransferase family 4 protein [Steroidobacteraceae bacterium]